MKKFNPQDTLLRALSQESLEVLTDLELVDLHRECKRAEQQPTLLHKSNAYKTLPLVETEIRYRQEEIRKSKISDELEKGKKAEIGEIRIHGGVKVQKTMNGWEPVKEGSSKKSGDSEKNKTTHTPDNSKFKDMRLDGIVNAKDVSVGMEYTDKNGRKVKVVGQIFSSNSWHPVVEDTKTGQYYRTTRKDILDGASPKEEREQEASNKNKMKEERAYTEDVLSFLKEEYDYKPMWVDRMTSSYRIKLGKNEEIAREIEKKFPGVEAKPANMSGRYGSTSIWSVKVPFKKSQDSEKVEKSQDSDTSLDILEKAKGHPEGTIKNWGGIEYIKHNGEWVNHKKHKAKSQQGDRIDSLVVEGFNKLSDDEYKKMYGSSKEENLEKIKQGNPSLYKKIVDSKEPVKSSIQVGNKVTYNQTRGGGQVPFKGEVIEVDSDGKYAKVRNSIGDIDYIETSKLKDSQDSPSTKSESKDDIEEKKEDYKKAIKDAGKYLANSKSKSYDPDTASMYRDRVKKLGKELGLSNEEMDKAISTSKKSFEDGDTEESTNQPEKKDFHPIGSRVKVQGKSEEGIIVKQPNSTTEQYSVDFGNGNVYGIMPDRVEKLSPTKSESKDTITKDGKSYKKQPNGKYLEVSKQG